MEAVILAGGMGTRLRSVVSNVPKCMAPVAGNPFLYYLLTTLEMAGFTHIILSLGYKHEVIEEWIDTFPTSMKISSVIEDRPLFTGGAVKLALTKAEGKEVFILNGDTFLGTDYAGMLQVHLATQANATLALKEMHDFDRYGLVDIEPATNRILQFREKQFCHSGLINGGVYLLNRNELDSYPEKFSLEKDYFEKTVSSHILSGYISEGYFIDIGIPEDYERAQTDFKNGRQKAI
jgi:D-glycero-alpha-D-manno-heptose 1-phosphate guanylyltransferase